MREQKFRDGMVAAQWWAAAVAMACVLAGCVQAPDRAAAVRLTGDPVVDDQARLAAAPPKDKVLWEYKEAAAALRRGQMDTARTQLDTALKTTAGILADTGAGTEAAAARGLFHQEADKPFVGEPYERIMADFYRGIIYWRDGEPDNARALFRSGGFLANAQNDKTHDDDWVLLDYLDGFVTTRLHGGDGSEALARARLRSFHPLPDYDPAANVLVFVEYGQGPRKYATGPDHDQLKIYSPDPAVTDARLVVAGQTLDLPPWDDVGQLAIMHGGRVMDQILGNKAEFKQVADTVGNLALAGAAATAVLGHGKKTEETAVAIALVGVGSKIASAATQPAADIRAWDNLPRYLSFAALRLSPGTYPATLTYYDINERPLPGTQSFIILVPVTGGGTGAGAAGDIVIFRSQLTE